MHVYLLQRIAIEIVLDFFWAPVWWYSLGFVRAVKWNWQLFMDGVHMMAPGLWVKNLFVPMYGQYDWQGRLMSFVMRLVNIIGRSIGTYIWMNVCMALLLVWVLLPMAVVGLFLVTVL